MQIMSSNISRSKIKQLPELSNQFEQSLAKPFLKWAGGKRQLLPAIQAYLPAKFTEYYEPFIGAGALLFALQPKKSTINDTNQELVNCYQIIRDQPEKLLELCQQHQANNSPEYYYQLRAQDRQAEFDQRTPVERAARIIYLNKTCFNGLFRVNSSGQFNVPYGKYKSPVIADPVVIKAISAYLNQAQVQILNVDFEQAVSHAKEGGFVYFDPPYHPLSQTSSFTGYSSSGFGEQEQIRLKKICDRLTDQGCQVLASNSAALFIKSLYDDPRYEIVEVKATRAINVAASKRGRINELLIHNKYMLKNDQK
jgi:DNA adenine methylase